MPSVPQQCRELEEEIRSLESLKRALEETAGNDPPGGGSRPGDGRPGGGDGPPGTGDLQPKGGGTDIDPDEGNVSIQGGHAGALSRLEEVKRRLREQREKLDECVERHSGDVPADAEEAIERRRRELEEAGRGLGDSKGLVERIDHGGSVRHFEHGRIYYHPNAGANEVRGGILQKYLDVGGPDRHPDSGRRELKFPTTGEIRSEDERYPVNHFEEGSIYWVRGTGGVVIFGPTYERWKAQGRELGPLGYPLTDTHERADGWVTYFERGALWTPSRKSDGIADFRFWGPPLNGGQTVVDPTADARYFPRVILGTAGKNPQVDIDLDDPSLADGLDAAPGTRPDDEPDFPKKPIEPVGGPSSPAAAEQSGDANTVERLDPEAKTTVRDLGTALWDRRLVLTPSDADADEVALLARDRGLMGWIFFDLAPADADALVDGTAYDVSLRLPNGSLRRLFSRAVLAQVDPDTVRSDIRFEEREMKLVGSVDVSASTREEPTVRLDPAEGIVAVGGNEREGTLRILDDAGRDRLRLDGETGDLHLALDGAGASPESLVERIRELERRLEDLEEA